MQQAISTRGRWRRGMSYVVRDHAGRRPGYRSRRCYWRHLRDRPASNESFSGWTKTCTDPRLCAAIVDRLTFGGTIVETGTHSYLLAHSRSQVVTTS